MKIYKLTEAEISSLKLIQSTLADTLAFPISIGGETIHTFNNQCFFYTDRNRVSGGLESIHFLANLPNAPHLRGLNNPYRQMLEYYQRDFLKWSPELGGFLNIGNPRRLDSARIRLDFAISNGWIPVAYSYYPQVVVIKSAGGGTATMSSKSFHEVFLPGICDSNTAMI